MKISNGELLLKLESNQANTKLAYVSNIKTITDQGIRNIIGDIIAKDEQRRISFVNKVKERAAKDTPK